MGAPTCTVTALEPPMPPSEPEREIVESLASGSTAARAASMMVSWSALASVITVKLALSDPPAMKEANPPDGVPTVICTSCTPATARSTFSTGSAAFSVVSSEDPAGMDWVTEKVFCPVPPSRLVGTSGTMSTVPARIATEASRVMTGWRWVPRSTGA